MKKLLFLSFLALSLFACKSPKSTVKVQETVEGTKKPTETIQVSGIEEADALSDDGSKMIRKPYKWYLGIAKADDKQTAIEMAQREAYATVTRVFNNIISDNAKRGTIGNNGNVQKATQSYWEQVALSITNACEPYGSVECEYDSDNRMYTAYAKVAVTGDRFMKMLNAAGAYKPNNLTQEELKEFIDINKSIIEAARGE